MAHRLAREGSAAFTSFHELRLAVCGLMAGGVWEQQVREALEPNRGPAVHVEMTLSPALARHVTAVFEAYGATQHAPDLLQTPHDVLEAVFLCPSPDAPEPKPKRRRQRPRDAVYVVFDSHAVGSSGSTAAYTGLLSDISYCSELKLITDRPPPGPDASVLYVLYATTCRLVGCLDDAQFDGLRTGRTGLMHVVVLASGEGFEVDKASYRQRLGDFTLLRLQFSTDSTLSLVDKDVEACKNLAQHFPAPPGDEDDDPWRGMYWEKAADLRETTDRWHDCRERLRVCESNKPPEKQVALLLDDLEACRRALSVSPLAYPETAAYLLRDVVRPT